MGILDKVFKKNKAIEYSFDLDLFDKVTTKNYMKRVAVEICIGLIARTIGQSEFFLKVDKDIIKDELYYRLNVRPNKNESASYFWQTVIRKLIYENECLIIKNDSDDLLIADSFTKTEYANYEDVFSHVIVRDYEFKRSFLMSEVVYLRYSNEGLSRLIEEMYSDYGELLGRLMSFQKRKNQIRATVTLEALTGKKEEERAKLQKYIDNLYKSIETKDISITPQTKGHSYEENQKPTSSSNSSVDELNKVTDGFLFQLASLLGIPIALLKGDMADVEKPTRNYIVLCVKPFIKLMKDEFNAKFLDMDEYLNGHRIGIKIISYHNIFDLATAIDKLISSTVLTGNEVRAEIDYERSDDPNMDKHLMTKNYQQLGSDSTEGGEKENDEA